MPESLRIHVADHPLVAHKLTTLRDGRTDSPTFVVVLVGVRPGSSPVNGRRPVAISNSNTPRL